MKNTHTDLFDLLDNLDYVVPPECQGQTCVYSYATCEIKGVWRIIERWYDRSDDDLLYTIYSFPRSGGRDAEFDPVNGAPKMGRELKRLQS